LKKYFDQNSSIYIAMNYTSKETQSYSNYLDRLCGTPTRSTTHYNHQYRSSNTSGSVASYSAPTYNNTSAFGVTMQPTGNVKQLY